MSYDDDYVSIHGICYDEGQAGNCGYECRGFLGGDCEIPDEIVEVCKDDLLKEYLGELRLAVYQTMDNYSELEQRELKKILIDYGYE